MTKRKLILIIINFILLVTFVMQLIFTNKGTIKNITLKENANKIVITNNGNTLTLSKKDDLWYVNSNYLAKNDLAEFIFNSANSLSLIETVSKNNDEQNFNKYGISQNLFVTLFTDDKELQTIFIGKPSVTNNQTYINIKGKKVNLNYLKQVKFLFCL